MSVASLRKKSLNSEIFKVIIITIPLFVGGIVFTFYFFQGFSTLRNYLFYLFIASIVAIGQIIIFLMRRKRILKPEYRPKMNDNVPSSFSQGSTSAQKESVKIDEHAVSYCLSCGKSFTKKYSFCPKCGS